MEASLRQRLVELSSLHRLGRALGRSSSLTGLCSEVLAEIVSATASDLGIICLLEGNVLRPRQTWPESFARQPIGSTPKSVGKCLCGRAAAGQAVYSSDIGTDLRYTSRDCIDAGVRSFAALPMLDRGELVGVLAVGSLKTRDYEQQAHFLEALAQQAALAIRVVLHLEGEGRKGAGCAE